jgi:hypothetical protein
MEQRWMILNEQVSRRGIANNAAANLTGSVFVEQKSTLISVIPAQAGIHFFYAGFD